MGLELGIVTKGSGLAHSHLNKIILDQIQEALTTSLKDAYDDAVNKAHQVEYDSVYKAMIITK